MDARTVNSLPPAATHDGALRCAMAIELSKTSWIVAVNTPMSEKISRYTLKGCDRNGLLDLIKKIRARRAKTDSIDVAQLLRSLMAYLRGDPRVWSVVRVPTVAEEDDRRLHRERDRLLNERVQHVNRIKGLCAVHGIYDYEPLRSNRMLRLEQLRTGDGRKLPPYLKAEIVRELQRLELVLTMIKTIEAERKAIISDKSPHLNVKKIQDLIKIKSIGPGISTVLVGEVFYRKFNNRQRLGSYVGLTPSHFQSGPMSRDQGISKAGNPKARTVMIE